MTHSEQGGTHGEAQRDDVAPRRAGASPVAIVCFIAVAVLVVGLDLGIKYVTFERVAGQPILLGEVQEPGEAVPWHPRVELVPHVLSLRLTTNPGAVFGMWSGQRWLFITVSIAAVAVLLHLFWRSEARAWPYHLGLALVLGGALGNLYDRLRYGVVRDMFFLFPEMGIWPWIFNLADAALMIGVGLVIVMIYLRERQARQQHEQAPQTDRA